MRAINNNSFPAKHFPSINLRAFEVAKTVKTKNETESIDFLGFLLSQSYFRSKIFFFISIFFPLAIVYSATAKWTLPQDPDVSTNAVSAWHLGKTGSPILPGYEHLTKEPYFGSMGSFTLSPNGTVSQYPPGAALLAAPLYALTAGELKNLKISNPSKPEISEVTIPLPSFWQATSIAVVSSSAAIALLGLIFLQLGTYREAWLGAWIAGLGTSAWSVASNALFMHGPDMLWIALGILLGTQKRYISSGLAFGAAVLTRPHTAFIPACYGIALGVRERSWSPIFRLGAASFIGVAALLVYNLFVFEKISVASGYGSGFAQNLVSTDSFKFLKNLIGALIAPDQGFLFWSPFFILLLPGLVQGWRNSETWVKGAALGGVVYFLLQYKMNRYNPGNTTLYRYPIESLVALAPLWFSAYLYWIKDKADWRRRLFIKGVFVAIIFQVVGIWLM